MTPVLQNRDPRISKLRIVRTTLVANDGRFLCILPRFMERTMDHPRTRKWSERWTILEPGRGANYGRFLCILPRFMERTMDHPRTRKWSERWTILEPGNGANVDNDNNDFSPPPYGTGKNTPSLFWVRGGENRISSVPSPTKKSVRRKQHPLVPPFVGSVAAN
ncbi:hypothetical protein ES703_66027 [subsurface metagenome]